jgi:hypothetical protein
VRSDLIHFNGVNAVDGSYLFPPITHEHALTLARRSTPNLELEDIQRWRERYAGASYGVRYGYDQRSIASSGWGLIMAAGADPAIKEALQPLLQCRRSQAGQRYRDDLEYRRGDDSKRRFLARYRARADGAVDPERVPYFLLIVGGPEDIPFEFQYQLDMQYAVGRLHFDTPEEYDAYARRVVEAEKGQRRIPRQAVVFAVRNANDYATDLSARRLAGPLAKELQTKAEGWHIEFLTEHQATKSALGHLLGGKGTPALLFTASHGVGFPRGHHLQRSHQGALLCQEWQPSNDDRPIPPEAYLAGEDISDRADLFGLISMHFACYGAGTPRLDGYAVGDDGDRVEIAPHPFVARLPQRLLSQGALAVIGHVDRAWSYSFKWKPAITDPALSVDVLLGLANGDPVGLAIEPLNERHAELAGDLGQHVEDMEQFSTTLVPNTRISELWAARNDARGTTVLGDPAVHLPLAGLTQPATPARETIAVASHDISQDRAASSNEHPVSGTSPDQEPARLGPQQKLEDAVERLTLRLVNLLELAIGASTTLEVATYTGTRSEDVLDADRSSGQSRLEALTRLDPVGRSELHLADRAQGVAPTVWSKHLQMTEAVRAYRAELLATAADVLTRLRSGAPGRDGV